MSVYTIRKAFPGSHHLYHGDDLVAKIEEIDMAPERRPLLLGWMPEKHRTAFKITHLPGIPDEHFMTLQGAAARAVDFHHNGQHVDTPHPIKIIGQHMRNLKNAIWNAASDSRMSQPQDQETLLELSQHHAKMFKRFKDQFGNED